MTGQRKSRFQPEISQAGEWFDLDRSIDMGNKVYFGLEPEDQEDEDESYEPEYECPDCGEADYINAGEHTDEDEHLFRDFYCNHCGKVFSVPK